MTEPTPQRPLVSICMPVYNGAKWIAEALDSALAQTYPELEIVVSDNASTDASVAIVRSYSDPRIRLHTVTKNTGPSANHNRTVMLARGDFIKFLHADDSLLPSCVEEMVALALEDPEIGLVFAPRQVLLSDPDDADSIVWAERFGELHTRFAHLQRINDGQELLRQIIAAGVEENWIGEPTSVLVRRAAFAEVGLFNEALYQSLDLDEWLRFLARFRVGFVDRPLSVYRHHAHSLTARNARTARDWLDTLWLLDTLCATEGLGSVAHAQAVRLRRAALRQAMRSQAKRILHGKLEPDLLRFLARRGTRRAPAAALPQ